ncbi:HPF/RaiA family ribosome-associated protein [Synechococcus sp. CCY 9618]|uniref:HPF/RaiA family ribosome-associated protein n=1 Tax=Synechococcus sp. CCY 9618 TaxID=2815602 RepID=UPI001C218FFA|nr:HPF/RaiA family ribosome-associated protein [Synechococcus sp. CCY 9618]
MQVQINTDHNIGGDERLAEAVEAAVRGALGHFGAQLTRVEVHLSDQNSDQKTGSEDMRCVLEARPAGHQPLSASDEAATVEQAVDGAARKLKHVLESTLDR